MITTQNVMAKFRRVFDILLTEYGIPPTYQNVLIQIIMQNPAKAVHTLEQIQRVLNE